jgi:hypothetical protein
MKHDANIKDMKELFVLQTRTLTKYETCNMTHVYKTGSTFCITFTEIPWKKCHFVACTEVLSYKSFRVSCGAK